MKKALVTGHMGFVGRHLVPKLEAAGYEVMGVDPKEDGLTLERFVRVAHKVTFDVVVHLAANIKDVNSRVSSGLESYDDILLDYSMADYLSVYPPKECLVWPTSCAIDYPNDPYAWVKLTGEKLFSTLEFPVYMLRPYSGYGGDQALSYPFPAILKRAMDKKDPLNVWGTGTQVRDFIHIDDLTDAFMMAVNHKFPSHSPIEIGTGVGTSMLELAARMAIKVGYAPEIKAMSYMESSSSYRVANTMLAEQLGFKAKISLEEGIERAINGK